jgi:ATP phosphoribosyltransferase
MITKNGQGPATGDYGNKPNKSDYLIEGNLRIILPDGHIKDGGFARIWEGTGLPYPEGKDYKAVVGDSGLRSLGYPKDAVSQITVVIRRPHDIPESIRRSGGMGVSGKDFYVDKLRIDSKGRNGKFAEALAKYNMIDVLDLGCRPSYIAVAFPATYGIGSMDLVKGRVLELDPERPIMATEFEDMCRSTVETDIGMDNYELVVTNGKTETWPAMGDTHGMLDVTETGDAIRDNDLRAVRGFVMERVTPHLVCDKDTYEMHAEVVDEINARLQQKIDELMEDDNYKHMFKTKLKTEGLFV